MVTPAGEREASEPRPTEREITRAALRRGLLHAGLVAAASFLTALPDPDIAWRTLISLSLLPAVSVLGLRWIGEGWYDAARRGRSARE